jgi:hypothetical protein
MVSQSGPGKHYLDAIVHQETRKIGNIVHLTGESLKPQDHDHRSNHI